MDIDKDRDASSLNDACNCWKSCKTCSYYLITWLDAGSSKAAAGAALNSFVGTVTKALKKKEGKVTLVGFGTFTKVRRKARKGRNPQTGATIKIKASNTVRFKPGKALKTAL